VNVKGRKTHGHLRARAEHGEEGANGREGALEDGARLVRETRSRRVQ
jgi:hypothetical protein